MGLLYLFTFYIRSGRGISRDLCLLRVFKCEVCRPETVVTSVLRNCAVYRTDLYVGFNLDFFFRWVFFLIKLTTVQTNGGLTLKHRRLRFCRLVRSGFHFRKSFTSSRTHEHTRTQCGIYFIRVPSLFLFIAALCFKIRSAIVYFTNSNASKCSFWVNACHSMHTSLCSSYPKFNIIFRN